MRRLLRALTKLSLFAAVAALVYRVRQRRSLAAVEVADPVWPPLVVPEEEPRDASANGTAPPLAEELAPPREIWLPPGGDSTCPASHPVKAKLASGVFHLPGMMHYDRTKPDRCYPDAASAEADGLRQAKR